MIHWFETRRDSSGPSLNRQSNFNRIQSRWRCEGREDFLEATLDIVGNEILVRIDQGDPRPKKTTREHVTRPRSIQD